jgi:hypothetical protein
MGKSGCFSCANHYRRTDRVHFGLHSVVGDIVPIHNRLQFMMRFGRFRNVFIFLAYIRLSLLKKRRQLIVSRGAGELGRPNKSLPLQVLLSRNYLRLHVLADKISPVMATGQTEQ